MEVIFQVIFMSISKPILLINHIQEQIDRNTWILNQRNEKGN